jgi:hypothetical protein
MKQNVSATINRPLKKATCIHHWLIEPATGPVSRGVCKFCGEQKDFFNILDEFQTNEEISVRSEEKDSTE